MLTVINSLGYIAGFIDGEGCLGIYKVKQYPSKYKGTYRVAIDIVNTNINVLAAIQCMLKQYNIESTIMQRTQYARWKCSYQLHIGKTNSLRCLLDLIEPFLIVKRAQAVLVRQYIDLRGTKNPEKREALYQSMKKLNKRGI